MYAGMQVMFSSLYFNGNMPMMDRHKKTLPIA
jgi:hypothetical protein